MKDLRQDLSQDSIQDSSQAPSKSSGLDSGESLKRRNFLEATAVAAAGVLASVVVPSAFAESKTADKKAEKSKASGRENKLLLQGASLTQPLKAVYEGAFACTKAGELCEAHCQARLSEGETDFALCSAAVQQMVVFSRAISKLVSLKSVRLKEILDGGIAAAQACKDACMEHEEHFAHGMHLECKECAASCTSFIAACKSLKKELSA